MAPTEVNLGNETIAAPKYGPRIRGVHTTKGAEGWCAKCEQHCPLGPDVCIGYIDGANGACCGHGVSEPWVVFEGGIEFRGTAAEEIFERHRRCKE